jgi:hypothetical protein
MEAENLVVSAGVKFPVKRQVRKAQRIEFQTHGYEVDLVGANADWLVLASVKSFFGSLGVRSQVVSGVGGDTGVFRLLNEPEIRDGVVIGAADRYGYDVSQVRMRLYVGRWAHTRGIDERAATKSWCADQIVGGGQIDVYDAADVVPIVRDTAGKGMYINDAVIVTFKVLAEAEEQLADPRRSLDP